MPSLPNEIQVSTLALATEQSVESSGNSNTPSKPILVPVISKAEGISNKVVPAGVIEVTLMSLGTTTLVSPGLVVVSVVGSVEKSRVGFSTPDVISILSRVEPSLNTIFGSDEVISNGTPARAFFTVIGFALVSNAVPISLVSVDSILKVPSDVNPEATAGLKTKFTTSFVGLGRVTELIVLVPLISTELKSAADGNNKDVALSGDENIRLT